MNGIQRGERVYIMSGPVAGLHGTAKGLHSEHVHIVQVDGGGEQLVEEGHLKPLRLNTVERIEAGPEEPAILVRVLIKSRLKTTKGELLEAIKAGKLIDYLRRCELTEDSDEEAVGFAVFDEHGNPLHFEGQVLPDIIPVS